MLWNWECCDLRALSGKFLREKSCYPESFCFFWLCWVHWKSFTLAQHCWLRWRQKSALLLWSLSCRMLAKTFISMQRHIYCWIKVWTSINKEGTLYFQKHIFQPKLSKHGCFVLSCVTWNDCFFLFFPNWCLFCKFWRWLMKYEAAPYRPYFLRLLIIFDWKHILFPDTLEFPNSTAQDQKFHQQHLEFNFLSFSFSLFSKLNLVRCFWVFSEWIQVRVPKEQWILQSFKVFGCSAVQQLERPSIKSKCHMSRSSFTFYTLLVLIQNYNNKTYVHICVWYQTEILVEYGISPAVSQKSKHFLHFQFS